jgi:hypothetical protein
MPEGRLKCGHPVGWILRLRDNKGTHRYCWGCAIEKIGLKEIDQPTDLVPPEITLRKKKDDNKSN